MEYDIENGLMHFSPEELKELHERRSPVDVRAASFILTKAQAFSSACVEEIGRVYAEQTVNRSFYGTQINALRGRAALLEQVTIELSSVAADVELRNMLDPR